jgi:hypothetical protein
MINSRLKLSNSPVSVAAGRQGRLEIPKSGAISDFNKTVEVRNFQRAKVNNAKRVCLYNEMLPVAHNTFSNKTKKPKYNFFENILLGKRGDWNQWNTYWEMCLSDLYGRNSNSKQPIAKKPYNMPCEGSE